MELEKTEPKNNIVALYLVISTFFTFALIVLLYFFLFKNVMQKQIRVKVEQAPTTALANLRHRETELLGQDINGRNIEDAYAVVDPGKGLYRIPIERAIELEAQGSWRANVSSAASQAAVPAVSVPDQAQAQADPASAPATPADAQSTAPANNNDTNTTPTP